MDLKSYQDSAVIKHKEQLGFLKKLKEKKPKSLDSIAKQAHHNAFNQINCLECANCCKTTGPLFTEKDIDRIAKLLRLSPQQFIAKYLVKDEDNDWILQTLPCPFLGEDNYCTIYESRPKACKEFPHTDRRKLYQINHLTIKNTKICPAAYLVVEEIKQRIKL